MLSHLAYISTREPNCTDQEIDKILAACKKNNPPIGITGILLYDNDQFLQYVEGDYKEINPLYDKIKKDDRHKDVIMVSMGVIADKIFPSWNMANKKINFSDIAYRTDISMEDKIVFDNILMGKEQQGAKIQNILKLIA